MLSVCSIVCLIMAINFGDALYPWNSGQIISLFMIAFVLFIAFFIQQRFAWLTTTEERMFPCHLLQIKEANLLFLCTACCNLASFLLIKLSRHILPIHPRRHCPNIRNPPITSHHNPFSHNPPARPPNELSGLLFPILYYGIRPLNR